MRLLAVAILFFLSVFDMESDQSFPRYVLSGIIGVPPGPKLDHIIKSIWQHGYNDLKELQFYVKDSEELKSFGFNALHVKRWSHYITTGSYYKMPKEKQEFEKALSYIIGVPSGSKLDEIMSAFSQYGYNDADDLWDVEKEELRSFGLKNLHLLRWRIYYTNERIYLVVHRWQVIQNGEFMDYPQKLSMRLEEAFENETGPIKHAISNGLAYQIDPVARTETHVLSGKRFGNTRRIKRVQVRFESKMSIKDTVSDIIGILPGLVLTQIMNNFFQNGYKTVEDLWYAEEEELRSFGLHESHIKRWIKYFNYACIYLIQSHWQYELDGGGSKFYREEVSRHLEEALEDGTTILYTGNGFTYELDAVACTQTNVQTGDVRKIRRSYNKMHWNSDIQDFLTVKELVLLAKKDEIENQ